MHAQWRRLVLGSKNIMQKRCIRFCLFLTEATETEQGNDEGPRSQLARERLHTCAFSTFVRLPHMCIFIEALVHKVAGSLSYTRRLTNL